MFLPLLLLLVTIAVIGIVLTLSFGAVHFFHLLIPDSWERRDPNDD